MAAPKAVTFYCSERITFLKAVSCQSCSVSAFSPESVTVLCCCDFAFDRVFIYVQCVYFDNSAIPAAVQELMSTAGGLFLPSPYLRYSERKCSFGA